MTKREEFQLFLRNLVKREKLTAIHVTHDQAEALTISDRVAVMNKGELIQLGSPSDLIYNPNHIFTSFFVGESDFLEGVVVNDEENEAEVKIGQSIIKTHNTGVPKGKRVAVAVRREFFSLEKMPTDEKKISNNYISGTIIHDQFLGLLRRVSVLLENQQIIEAKIHAKHPVHFNENEAVKVRIDPAVSRCFAFPEEGIAKVLEM